MDLSIYEKKFDNQKTYLVIPSADISSLIKKFSSKTVIDKIAASIRGRFPNKSYQMTHKDLLDGFHSLSEWGPTWANEAWVVRNMPYYKAPLHFDGKPLLLETPSSQYSLDKIPEYFTDEHRMGVQRYDVKHSPITTWKKQTARIVGLCLNKYKRIDPESLRETVYSLGQEATEFKVTVGIAIIKKFKATRMLDISAGRGIRLFAALVSQLSWYVACDPDTGLIPIHESIVKLAQESGEKSVGASHTKVQICYKPFEDMSPAELQCKEFDLIFTSPPYFNLEIYSDASTQSVSRYPEVDQWINGFLFPALKKAWELLARGGTMAININDVRGGPQYVVKMIGYASKLPNSKFRGVIGYGDNSRGKPVPGQPIWCWTKV
ncbi:hypothetical protein BNJ_00262 [Kaumoebavirus]|uniref:hypothetical protein n=1 Tax=Kaumoebavirus TaxID=1859492 RepID=UPI0009C346B0|nr:hypothetical protein BNJ_00262 [Kaumoebavirus]ARA72087.1 hypothetical protein BNJ_00262 [Kaumoebavirus]